MPLLFSYGSIQEERVQVDIAGRKLAGTPDEVLGFELTRRGPYFNVKRSAAARVAGTAYEVTDAELAAFDAYEGDEWVRVEVTLASGRAAWVYIAPTSE